MSGAGLGFAWPVFGAIAVSLIGNLFGGGGKGKGDIFVPSPPPILPDPPAPPFPVGPVLIGAVGVLIVASLVMKRKR